MSTRIKIIVTIDWDKGVTRHIINLYLINLYIIRELEARL